jgi:hypothetical protein
MSSRDSAPDAANPASLFRRRLGFLSLEQGFAVGRAQFPVFTGKGSITPRRFEIGSNDT